MAATVGIPAWSSWIVGEAAVPPSMPSKTMASTPAFAAMRTSLAMRAAPTLIEIGTLYSVTSRISSSFM